MIRVQRILTGQKKIVVITTNSFPDFLAICCKKFDVEKNKIRCETEGGITIEDEDGLKYVSEKDLEVLMIDNINSAFDQGTSSSSIPENHVSKKPWPGVYQLPPLPRLADQLAQGMRHKSEGAKLKSQSRFVHTLMNYVFTDLLQYFNDEDPFPTPSQYSQACQAIVQKYPFLEDTDIPGGYKDWKKRLVQKFKDYRRRKIVSPSLKIIASRQKFSRKRVLSDASEYQQDDQKNDTSIKEDCFDDSLDDLSNSAVKKGKKLTPAIKKGKKSARRNRDDSDTSSNTNDSYMVLLDDDDLQEEMDDCFDSFDENESEFSLSTEKRIDISIPFVNIRDLCPLENKEHEFLRHETNLLGVEQKCIILSNMKKMFPLRVTSCQRLTVHEELTIYPCLKEPYVLFQETVLMLDEYSRCRTPGYSVVDHNMDIPLCIQEKAINLCYRLRPTISRYKRAAPYLATDASRRDTQIKLGLIYAAIRLRCSVHSFFSKKNAVHIIGSPLGQWTGCVINGSFIPTDGTRETLALFICSFIAFNLKHLPANESVLELLEYLIKFRHYSTKASVRSLIASL